MLQHRCLNAVSEYERNQGSLLARDRRVILDSLSAERAEAAVVDGAQVFEVRLDWSHAGSAHSIDARCTCPRSGQAVACRHLWATLLELDREAPSLEVAGEGALTLAIPHKAPPRSPYFSSLDFEDLLVGSWLPPPQLLSRSIPAAMALPALAPAPVLPAWRSRLEALKRDLGRAQPVGRPRHREAYYRMTLDESTRARAIVLRIYERVEKVNGEWGKVKAARLGRDEPATYSDPADRELLVRLFDLAMATDPRSASRGHLATNDPLILPSGACDSLLPRLCATGRFGWAKTPYALYGGAQTLGWDGDEPWHLRLRLDHDPERKTATLRGLLERGEHRRPIEDALLVLGTGWMIFPESVGRLAGDEPMALIALLREKTALSVPESEIATLLEDLWRVPKLPPVEAPPAWRLEEVHLEPRPQVELRSSRVPAQRGMLDAKIAFFYGDAKVDALDPTAALVDRAAGKALVRDLAAERAWLEPLPALGFRFRDDARGDAECQINARAIDAAIDALLAAGWRVTSEGRRWRATGAFRLNVSSGIDWFELSGDLTFEDAAIDLPRLLEAIRRGEREIGFDDGSRARLPEEWLGRLGHLAGLAYENDGRKLKFRPSQTLLLDALLQNAPEVDVDAAFARVRDRLRGFERIEPAREPRGFRGELRPYQREGLGWLRFLREFGFGGCLADDMGLGKTIQLLALLQSLRLGPAPAGGRRPSLIVAPRSLIFNWLDEAARFTPRLRVVDYSGPGRAEVLEHIDEHDVILTTYGVLRRDVAKLRQVELELAVLDEAQAIKNDSSQVAKASRLLVARQRLALTGTPVENHLGELWSIFEFLNPGMLGRLKGFAELTGSAPQPTATAQPAGSAASGEGALDLLGRALRPFILRRTKKQVLSELPEKTEQTLHCELEGKERRFYESLRDAFRLQLAQRIETMGFARAKIHVLEALLRLRQAASHWGLVDASHTGETSAKLETLLEQLDEVLGEGHKALVFSQFVSLLTIVRRHVETRGWSYEYLDGKVRDRKTRVDRFQNDPDCQLFLISLKAGGQGLNLTAADYVFILDPWWNPAVEAQAVDRAHRIGQTKPVFVYRLISTQTVEEKIVELQRSKRELADAILTADKSLIRELTAEDLRLLLS